MNTKGTTLTNVLTWMNVLVEESGEHVLMAPGELGMIKFTIDIVLFMGDTMI